MSMQNTTTVARACRACLAASALVVLSASLAQAAFGPRTVIGEDYQQWSSTMSTDGITEGSCDGSFFCYVLFQRAPKQKRLIVQHVLCRLSVSPSGLRDGLLLTRKGQIFQLARAYLTPVNTTVGISVMNSPVIHRVESKEYLVVRLTNTLNANWAAECNISGKLQQP